MQKSGVGIKKPFHVKLLQFALWTTDLKISHLWREDILSPQNVTILQDSVEEMRLKFDHVQSFVEDYHSSLFTVYKREVFYQNFACIIAK